MKKVLLVGELNQTVSSVNEYLSTCFKTQICMDSLELVKGMTKVFQPDMVVICLVGVGELDVRIIDLFRKKDVATPVLVVGTPEECKYYEQIYQGNRIAFVTRPTTSSVLIEKCSNMLAGNIVKEEESISVVDISAIDSSIVEKEQEKRKCILTVDDSGILLRNVKNMLANEYDVVVANSGVTAISQAKKKKPDLILLDYEMPEWDGKRTLEEIQKDDEIKNIPVVFLTGVADKDNIAAVLKLKPAGYLLKPVEPQKLLETIEKVLSETTV